MKKSLTFLIWLAVAALGACAYLTIALQRGEPLNSAYILTAALCTYAIGYRFYSKWIAARVLALDDRRATPCEIHEDGQDYVKTNKWIVFGHHFAAISGPGPLVGPVLAAQFGYLPGTLWILIGVVLGGAVQDFVILASSIRRDGKSLGQMVREELNPAAGVIGTVAILSIMIILLAVLGLVVVNALAESPWGVFTVAATVPIAMFMGGYLRWARVGKVLEASVLGVALLLAAVWGGQFVHESAAWSPVFTVPALTLAKWIIGYGLAASVAQVNSYGAPFHVTVEQMTALAATVQEKTLFGRTGGAATLAVGMAHIFAGLFGKTMLGIWYHFALMFEALFILTTLDAGTRVGRYLIQDALGHVWKPLGDPGNLGANILASALIVAGWGYFLINGVLDPEGGTSALWPLFGIANQLLASIALCLATTILLKMQLTRQRRPAVALVTLLPLAWLLTVTTTAAVQKVWHENPKIGFLAAARALDSKLPALQQAAAAASADQLPAAKRAVKMNRTQQRNMRVDAFVTGGFLALVGAILALSLREWALLLSRRKPAVLRETAPVWLPADAPERPLPVMGAIALGFTLLKEVSGEAAIDRERDRAAACECAAPDMKPSPRRNVFLTATEQRFRGVNRCC